MDILDRLRSAPKGDKTAHAAADEIRRLRSELARHKEAGRDAERLADAIVRAVAELPDRDSPADWPAAMLVTSDELRSIVLAALREEVKP